MEKIPKSQDSEANFALFCLSLILLKKYTKIYSKIKENILTHIHNNI